MSLEGEARQTHGAGCAWRGECVRADGEHSEIVLADRCELHDKPISWLSMLLLSNGREIPVGRADIGALRAELRI